MRAGGRGGAVADQIRQLRAEPLPQGLTHRTQALLLGLPRRLGGLRRGDEGLDHGHRQRARAQAALLAAAKLQLNEGPIKVMQLSRTYNGLLERLAQSWSQQRQFVSTVSHELHTPLTIVQRYLHRTIKRGDNLSPN